MNPNTPAASSSASEPRLPGTAPPQKPMSTYAAAAAAGRLSWSARTVVVGGMELSGMSTIVVTPPAAAARVAERKPSHSVRPGSLTWTWESTSPGSSTASGGSRTTPSAAASGPSTGPAASGVAATMTPSRMSTRAARSSPSTQACAATIENRRVASVICALGAILPAW